MHAQGWPAVQIGAAASLAGEAPQHDAEAAWLEQGSSLGAIGDLLPEIGVAAPQQQLPDGGGRSDEAQQQQQPRPQSTEDGENGRSGVPAGPAGGRGGGLKPSRRDKNILAQRLWRVKQKARMLLHSCSCRSAS